MGCESFRSVPQSGRSAWQILHIASTLAASGPAVRGSLQGAPVPPWTRAASDSSVRVGPRCDTSGAPCSGRSLGRRVARGRPTRGIRAHPWLRAWQRPLGWELAATAVSAFICPYQCHICMYTVCICLYLHVCVCVLNQLGKKVFKYEMSYCMYVACLLYVFYVFRLGLSPTVTVTLSQAGTCVTQLLAVAAAEPAGRWLHYHRSNPDSDQ